MFSIIDDDITGKDYQFLLDTSLQYCNRFAFIMRPNLMGSEIQEMAYFHLIIADIKSSFLQMKQHNSWETQQHLNSTAYAFYFELNETTLSFLKHRSASLFGWKSSYILEDLIFYNNDEIWLAANSQEGWYSVNFEANSTKEVIEYFHHKK